MRRLDSLDEVCGERKQLFFRLGRFCGLTTRDFLQVPPQKGVTTSILNRAFTQMGRASLRTGGGCFSCSRPADMIPSVTLNNGALMPVLALGTWKVRLNFSL